MVTNREIKDLGSDDSEVNFRIVIYLISVVLGFLAQMINV